MGVPAISSATVIPFRMPATRQAPGADGPRGEILLFTGVRYERRAEPTPEPQPDAPVGRSGPRTRRRRR